MKPTAFDEIINSVSSKYDAFTVEKSKNIIVYTLVSDDRSDFSVIEGNLNRHVEARIDLNGINPYQVRLSEDLGLHRIIFEKILS